VNENHARVCGGPEWAAHLQVDILPVVTRDVDLGEHMLEIGPGPGAATEWLRQRVSRLTAVEIDPEAASALEVRFPDVEVVTADATDLPYPDESFDSVGTFTALHHVPTRHAQDKFACVWAGWGTPEAD
jgi:16S rRNA A1518/A1519 N6-dimethyltransferase RsmA/KsgA/DIM1 with predicted DNA glycosylase/AP lyase activity